MADPRFFTMAGPFTVSELASLSRSVLQPADADPCRLMKDLAPLETAGAADISFLDNRKYASFLKSSLAGACILQPRFADQAPPSMVLLVTMEPYLAYALVAQAFYPQRSQTALINPNAIIDPSARIGSSATIAAGVIIEERVEIGNRCRIAENAVISQGVIIGDDCTIGEHVSLSYCIIGDRVTIQSGARLGQDGFGFAIAQQNNRGNLVKIPQVGRVVVGNDVEIGANTTIDRGSIKDTIIGDNCKIDNLVQIGHNVQLEKSCIIAAQVGIAGSTVVNACTMIGGQAGLTGHLSIGSQVRIGAQAGVMRDVSSGTTVMGSPAQPSREYWRQIAVLKARSRRHCHRLKHYR